MSEIVDVIDAASPIFMMRQKTRFPTQFQVTFTSSLTKLLGNEINCAGQSSQGVAPPMIGIEFLNRLDNSRLEELLFTKEKTTESQLVFAFGL